MLSLSSEENLVSAFKDKEICIFKIIVVLGYIFNVLWKGSWVEKTDFEGRLFWMNYFG